MKLPRFTLRELFLLVVIAAMGCGWWVRERKLAAVLEKTKREVHEIRNEIDEKDHWKGRAIMAEARYYALGGPALPAEAFRLPVFPRGTPAAEASNSELLVFGATLSTLAATLVTAAVISGMAYLVYRIRLRTPELRLFASRKEAIIGAVAFLVLGCASGSATAWFVYSVVWYIVVPDA